MQIRSLAVTVFVALCSCRCARAVAVGRFLKQAPTPEADASLEDIPDVVDMTETAEAAHSEIERMHEHMAQIEVMSADAPAADLALEAEKPLTTEDSLAASSSSTPTDQKPSVTDGAPIVAAAASKDDEVAAAVATNKDSDAFEAKLEAEAKEPIDAPEVEVADSKNASVQPATATDSSFEATENAITLLHRKYAQERHTAGRLKQEVSEAVDWGKKLERRLRGEIKDAKSKEYEEKKVLAQESKEASAKLEAEKSHEHNLEDLFSRTNKTLSERGTQLQTAETELKSIKAAQQKLAAQALRALKKERNKTSVLQRAVKRATADKAELHSQLERSLGDLSVARTEWRAEEERLLKSKNEEAVRKDSLEANLTKVKDELFALQAAKKIEDMDFAMSKENLKKGWKVTKSQLAAARNREATLKKLLNKEKVEITQTDEKLQQAIAAWKKKADDEQVDGKKLQKELSDRSNGQHAEVTKLNDQLSVEANKTQRLQKERAYILEELQGNTTKAMKLEEEVTQLRLQLKNGENAKRKAESLAKRAQEETAAAQAVVKQLSGTVPRLLEQAQHAKEAKEADDAKREREQIVEKQQLNAEYAPAVQTQLADLHRVLPALGVTTAAPSDDDSEATSEAPADEELLHLGLDEKTNTEEAANASTDSADSKDTAKDDIGLNQLLEDD